MRSIKRFGFSLIELLVVIAIIGILASIILASLSSARAKARDGRRKVDLDQIRKAIEIYITVYNDVPNNSGPGNCNPSGGCNSTEAQPWISAMNLLNINNLPVDPSNSATYRYRYRPTAAGTYEVDAPIESDFPIAEGDGGNENDCSGPDTCRYELGSDLTRLREGP